MSSIVKIELRDNELPKEKTLMIYLEDFDERYMKLTVDSLQSIIDKYRKDNVTCICFVGGESNYKEINEYAMTIRFFEDFSIAWCVNNIDYSTIKLHYFDYIKVLSNSKIYRIHMTREIDENHDPVFAFEDITGELE